MQQTDQTTTIIRLETDPKCDQSEARNSFVGRPSGIDIAINLPLKREQLARYDYWGLANTYRVTYEPVKIKSGLGTHGVNPVNRNAFTSLDQFDRLRQMAWYRDKDALVDLAYRYDRTNDVFHQADHLAPLSHRDEVYGRDLLDRLISLRRGKGDDLGLTVPPKSKDGTSGLQFSQEWMLDYAGNWRVFSQDNDGIEDLRQLRLHTQSNDILALQPSKMDVHAGFAGAGLGTAKGAQWYHQEYDDAGNLIRIPQPNKPDEGYKCIYDAWNRLAVVGVPLKNCGIRKVARFCYDGLGRVVTKLTYNELEHLTEERHFVYSGDQLIQEQVYNTTGDKRFGKFRIDRQYVWGPRGPNDLILRLRDKKAKGIMDERRYALQDAQGNVVALADENGKVQERFRYRPSGEVEFHDAAYQKPKDEAGKELDGSPRSPSEN